MTTIAIKQLANGQLAAATAASILTAATATQILVKSITLVNTNTTTEYVDVYVLKSGGTAREITPVSLAIPAGYKYVYNDIITLEAGDAITARTTTASKVDYTISGVTES